MIGLCDAQLKNNIVDQSSENHPDYLKLKSRKAQKKPAVRQEKQQKPQNMNLSISKHQEEPQPHTLKIIKEEEDHPAEDPQIQPKSIATKNIAAFLEEDSSDSDENHSCKENEPPQYPLPSQIQDQIPKPAKLFADFCSEDQEQSGLPEISVLNLDTEMDNPSLILEPEVEEKQVQKQIIPESCRFFAVDERTFATSPIPTNTTVKVCMNYLANSSGDCYQLFLGENEVMSCISKNCSFVFENSDGMLAHMQYVRGLYEIFVYNDDLSFMGACGMATIQIERKNIRERKFSSVRIFESIRKNSSRTAKWEYEKDPSSVRIFRSRDPFMNGEGKLELKINLAGNIRPSPFNCLIEDQQGTEVCSLLESTNFQIFVSDTFTVLLGMCCAVARFHWSNQFKR